MPCSICRQSGHTRPKCPVLDKGKRAQIELALTERRYALEAANTFINFIQVPVVTAGLWFAMSRANATLGVLNKAILTAELAPIIGDIKFPEGVLLGAAIESTEDFVNLLSAEGLIGPWEELKEKAEKVAVPYGDALAGWLTPNYMKNKSCADLGQRVWELHLMATDKIEGPEGVVYHDWGSVNRITATQAFGVNLKAMKDNGCPRPTHPYFSPPEQWDRL